MVDIKRTKLGFSLAEALVSMLVLSIFFLASSRMITSKPKKEIEMNRHGYFECFVDRSGILKQKRSDGSYAGAVIQVNDGNCRCTPPAGSAFVVMYALNNGRFYNWSVPQFNSDNGHEEIVISRSELSSFQSNMEADADDPMREGNDKLAQLENFFMSSYPSSSIYQEMLKGKGADDYQDYEGPAVFIGW